MNDDALAALLDELPDGLRPHYPNDRRTIAQFLVERSVVVLPADHPLRTGEPSKAMRNAFIEAAEVMMENEDVDAGLRAALAVLREPLDKQG